MGVVGSPSLPPKRTTVSFHVASAVPARAGGDDGDANAVHVEPSHSQVSFKGPSTPIPPKRTILFPTVTMAWSVRAGGLIGGESSVHVAPSHSQVAPSTRAPVAPNGVPLSAVPPKRNTLLPSAAMA